MQGPYGFQEAIDVNSSTQYNGSNSLSSLMANGLYAVEGTVQADGSILANSVELITTDKAFISGTDFRRESGTGGHHVRRRRTGDIGHHSGG